MNVRLRQDDAAAVDLLLDRAVSARGNGNGGNGDGAMFVSTNHAGVATDRIAAVERVLHVLDAMPNGDPSPDLLQRTLQRVEAGSPGTMRGPTGPILPDPARPMA
jgi:hypothetical protein